MVEYFRLIKDDWLPRLNDWSRQDLLVLVAVLAGVLLVGYFIARR